MNKLAIGPALLALAVLGGPALSQGSSLQDVVSGKDTPLTLHMKDLNSDWKRMTLSVAGSGGGMSDMLSQLMQMGMMSGGNKGGGADAAMGMAFMSSMFGGGGGGGSQPVYYTKGQTSSLGGETFLIAYKYDKPEVNFMQLIMESQQNGGKEPDFAKLSAAGKMTADLTLSLSLINVKTIGTMGGIRAFDLNQELADAQKGPGGLFDLMAARKDTTDLAAPATAAALTPIPAEKAKPVTKPKPKKP